ncbi:MAG: hypothetical protein Q4D05_01925 [Acinetobacter sp.]|nr:hypothetical protein [Acinetobacter sp.]
MNAKKLRRKYQITKHIPAEQLTEEQISLQITYMQQELERMEIEYKQINEEIERMIYNLKYGQDPFTDDEYEPIQQKEEPYIPRPRSAISDMTGILGLLFLIAIIIYIIAWLFL